MTVERKSLSLPDKKSIRHANKCDYHLLLEETTIRMHQVLVISYKLNYVVFWSLFKHTLVNLDHPMASFDALGFANANPPDLVRFERTNSGKPEPAAMEGSNVSSMLICWACVSQVAKYCCDCACPMSIKNNTWCTRTKLSLLDHESWNHPYTFQTQTTQFCNIPI